MTYDRVGRSFAERFAAFAEQLRPLATGFCLPAANLFFGITTYGEEEVNVAYRDIEVRYQFGWQPACQGRYIQAAEIEQLMARNRSQGLRRVDPRGSFGASGSRTAAGGGFETVHQGASRPPAAGVGRTSELRRI